MASVATPGKTLQHSSSSSSLTKDEPCSLDYEPQVERMIDYLSPLEIKEIESIVTKYMHAYQHVPYRTELRYYDNDRPGFQVMEVSRPRSVHFLHFLYAYLRILQTSAHPFSVAAVFLSI